MSNLPNDHPSIRVCAPPGGRSNNIFGTSEFEQSAANKKKQSESNIFGYQQDKVEPAATHVTHARHAGNNIFGTEPAQPAVSKGNGHADKNKADAPSTHSNAHESNTTTAGEFAEQYKQTQMKSSIFGTNEPTVARNVSDKNRSDIFGVAQNEQNSRHGGLKRDPNASRMGYNPINGEAYSMGKNAADSAKPAESDSAPTQVVAETTAEHKDNSQAAAGGDSKQNSHADQTANGNNAQKNPHTSVRVFHPPGGRSNGPLW